MKSMAGQKPTSSSVNLDLKNKLASAFPGKAYKLHEITSSVNALEQTQKILSVAGLSNSKTTVSCVPKPIKHPNNMNFVSNHQMKNEKSYETLARVKETTEMKHDVFSCYDKSQRITGFALNQQKNLGTVGFTNACRNNLRQAPSSKATPNRLPGVTSMESCHMQAEMRKELQTVSSQKWKKCSRNGHRTLE